MSTMSQFLGGGVEAVQRGEVSMGPTDGVETVTISAVDLSKSLLVFSNKIFPTTTTDNVANWSVRGTLTNSTTITFTRDGAASATAISWQVIEYV